VEHGRQAIGSSLDCSLTVETFCTVEENDTGDACPASGSLADVETIGSAIASRAKTAGDSPALVGVGYRDITFSQLLSSISSFAPRLAHAGLGREDRVGLLVPPGVPGGHLVVALASNVTLVPVNPALTVHEIIEMSEVTGLSAVVIPQWLETAARSAMLQHGLKVLQAVLAPDGALSLELLTPAPATSAESRPARPGDIALVLRSSGTTGAPKLIPVTHRNLLAMAEKLGSGFWFNLSARDRAACTLPLYYAAGLKTTLFVPLILGASVGFPPPAQASDLAAWVGTLQPTYLSVSPGLLNGILDRARGSKGDLAGGSLRFVMCAAAYLPEDVRLAAQNMLGVPVLEFYGLSEAGVMAANPVPPGMNKPGTVGVPAPGELLIVGEDRQPLAHGAVGQILISGPTVTPGYLVAERSSAVETSAVESSDGWLLTGDLGRIDAEGYLTIMGRVKEVINRGGEKVFPYEIEKAILEHPAVLEAAAFGVPHPRLGESVAAAAVLKPGSTVSEQQLKEFLAGQLAAFKLPRALWFVSSLPRGNTGKVLRSKLTEAYGAARREIAEPSGLLELELCQLWSRLLGRDDIGIDDDFFEKGGDSLLATEMLLEVELLTGKPYPQSELSTFTIRRIVDVVAAGLADERELITQVKSGPGIPLFFCHGDYLTRGIYAHRLAALLPGDHPVFLLHCYPDRFLGSSMEDIARAYLREVLRVAPDSPLFVGGYCNGGLAAWHLAHLLRSQGVEVLELLLIETVSLNARPALRGLPRLFERLGRMLPGRTGRFLREGAMRGAWILTRKSFAELAPLLYRAARTKVLSAVGREAALQPRRDASQKADKMYYQFMSRYVPPRTDVEVTCVIAQEGKHFDTDPTFWRGLAPKVNEVRVPGEHTSALIAERQALAAVLGEALKRAEARHSTRTAAVDLDATAKPVRDSGLSIGKAQGGKPVA
jgi:oxalate---CoA ligase